MTSVIAYLVLSILLVMVSWKSLRDMHSHGFYRFFAWEAILALILLNLPVWFKDPFLWYQILSWILLSLSFIPFVMGVRSLRLIGKPDKEARRDSNLLGFEHTTQLVTTGIYSTIRHPLYSSLFLLNWGVYLKLPSAAGTLLACAATLFLVATAKADERECIQYFGGEYSIYMKRTKMFIPFIL